MKRSLLHISLAALFLLASCSPSRRSGRTVTAGGTGAVPSHVIDYINRFSTLAVSEMNRSGIPASITLAQGMLESDYGRSRLATKANNHFGIKCHNDWQGERIFHDDNRRGECFRSYSTAWESYRDHSDFLVKGSRYRDLFSLARTDYKGWAHGLKRAGYATDPKYASHLIRKIEEYQLWAFDSGGVPALIAMQQTTASEKPPAGAAATGKVASGESVRPAATATTGSPNAPAVKSPAGEPARPAGTGAAGKAAAAVTGKPAEVGEGVAGKPADVAVADDPDEEPIGVISFSTGAKTLFNNGVEYVVAAAGDTYESLARQHQLLLWEITRFNDVAADASPVSGQPVYLGIKRTRAAKGLTMHVVTAGETMHSVSQKYAIRLSSLYKLNLMEEGTECKPGQRLRIR